MGSENGFLCVSVAIKEEEEEGGKEALQSRLASINI